MAWMAEIGPDCESGLYMENMFEAEMIREVAARGDGGGAIVVSIEGVVYTGVYDFIAAYDYAPGEWKTGASISVRLSGDELTLKRPNGRLLRTTIVKRIG